MNRQELNKKVGQIVKKLITGKGVVAPLEVFLRLGVVSPEQERYTTHYVVSQDHNK